MPDLALSIDALPIVLGEIATTQHETSLNRRSANWFCVDFIDLIMTVNVSEGIDLYDFPPLDPHFSLMIMKQFQDVMNEQDGETIWVVEGVPRQFVTYVDLTINIY